MVVLSAAVLTRSGQVLCARQFVDMSRLRIENLIAAFPKLLGVNQQHTFVETDDVRYVYQPIDSLYVLLVTNLGSNIVEDLETLRLLSKLVPEFCGAATEEDVSNNIFELVGAFDEAISSGYREELSVSQIQTNTEMESNEEKLHDMIRQSKINEAREEAKKKAAAIREQQRELAKQGLMKQGSGIGARVGGGFGGGPSSLGSDGPSASSLSAGPPEPRDAFGNPVNTSVQSEPQVAQSRAARPMGAGMKLGMGKSKDVDLVSAMAEEDGLQVAPALGSTSGMEQPAPSLGAPAVPMSDVHVVIGESANVVLKRDGGLDSMEVNGHLDVIIAREELAHVSLVTARGENAGFRFRPHPNMDKGKFSKQSILHSNKPDRPFVPGQPAGLLKWRLQTSDESFVPLTINCWPESVGAGQMNVNVEFQLENESITLHDVVISIPCSSASDSRPEIVSADGTPSFDGRTGTLQWRVDMIDASNTSGMLEFNFPSRDDSAFFPIEVSFTSPNTLSDITVSAALLDDGSEAGGVSIARSLAIESYSIE